MKRRGQIPFLIGMIGVLLVATSAADAQEPEEAAPGAGRYKIGVVDIREVFDQYSVQKEEYQKLKEERDALQQDIDRLADEANAANDRYQAEKNTMTQEERIEAEERIKRMRIRWQTEFDRMQAEIDLKERNLLKRVTTAIRKAVAEIGAKENYHVILEADESGRGGVLYFSPTLNMTSKVISYLNSQPRPAAEDASAS